MPLKGFTPEITNSEIGKLIGREIIKLENGKSEVSFEMTMLAQHAGHFAWRGFCDHAGYGLRCNVRSLLDMEKYRGHATLEVKASYLKASKNGKYIAKGKVLRMGRSVAYSEAGLFDSEGVLVSSLNNIQIIAKVKQDSGYCY